MVTTWAARIGWLAIPCLLLILAVHDFGSAVATETAFPVPTYLLMNVPLPQEDYRDAADALARVTRRDGDAKIAQADAALHAGLSPGATEATLLQGLAATPASARGWAILAELTAASDPHLASASLAHSLKLAPWDYWLAARRARDAALLWPVLSQTDRKLALRQIALLWDEPVLRNDLVAFLGTQDGPALIAQAFEMRPDKLREINRWLSLNARRNLIRASRRAQRQ